MLSCWYILRLYIAHNSKYCNGNPRAWPCLYLFNSRSSLSLSLLHGFLCVSGVYTCVCDCVRLFLFQRPLQPRALGGICHKPGQPSSCSLTGGGVLLSSREARRTDVAKSGGEGEIVFHSCLCVDSSLALYLEIPLSWYIIVTKISPFAIYY